MKQSKYRFDCNIDNDNYIKFVKLQTYYSKLFNKKVTLTDTFIICLQNEYESNLEELRNITIE